MTVYNLIETATGKLIADSYDPITKFSADRSVVETPDRKGIWNQSTLDYDPRPIDRRISHTEFMARFTDEEKEDLVEAAKTIKKANTFIKMIPMMQIIDRDDTFIVDAVNGMGAVGIIGVGRAAEILS